MKHKMNIEMSRTDDSGRIIETRTILAEGDTTDLLVELARLTAEVVASLTPGEQAYLQKQVRLIRQLGSVFGGAPDEDKNLPGARA